jgi:hypothetical protein
MAIGGINLGTTMGLREFSRSFNSLAVLAALNRQGLERAANVLLNVLKITLNQAGSGRWYPSRTGQGMHQASAPGEPPAPDTRKLLKSAHIEHPGPEVVRVMVDGKAAAVLEHGSRNRKLKPRPFMRPSLKKATPLMRVIMRKHGAIGGIATLRRGAGLGQLIMKVRI